MSSIVLYYFQGNNILSHPNFKFSRDVIEKLIGFILQTSTVTDPNNTSRLVESVRDVFRGTGKELEDLEICMLVWASMNSHEVRVTFKELQDHLYVRLVVIDQSGIKTLLEIGFIFQRSEEMILGSKKSIPSIRSGSFITTHLNEINPIYASLFSVDASMAVKTYRNTLFQHTPPTFRWRDF